ncbi:MAG TPA: HAD family hydrolase [Solirubrobacteraceae bacterium]
MALAILDVDGTLVDTNYQHAIAWSRAFRSHEIELPIWRIHRHIGMGGDQLVAALTDEVTERRLGEQVRAAEQERYRELIDEVQPLRGSRELIEDLRERGHTVVLASSARPPELEHYLDLLQARELVDACTSAEDVERTKPAPDLVNVALARAGAQAADAVMVGDSSWDAEAAIRAGVATLAVLTGGFSSQELLEAGAERVFGSVEELREALGETALA